jgi:DNA polymerase-3 subunit delta
MSTTQRRPSGSGAIKPAYLIAGTDEGKIDAALSRLRARAEREGGPGALESFAPDAGQGPPDAGALIAAIPSMSLMAARRYLLADGVERWTAKQAEPVIAALGTLPPDLTVVLVAREVPSKTKAPGGIAKAIEAAGGEVLRYQAPRARELAPRLVADASQRGFRLEPDAARLLVERLGEGTLRLANELDRLALWAGPEGVVAVTDLEAMVADTSEEAAWTLSDAIVARDPRTAIRAADRLAAQGEGVTPLTYQAARRLREAHTALLELEAGRPQREVEARLKMHPYAAKMLVRRLRGGSPADLRAATCAIADLEWWTRGGSEYPDDVALTLAVRRAAGAGAGAG